MPTGKDNADRFVSNINEDNREIVQKFVGNWPWMCNRHWREYVLDNIDPSVFSKAYFRQANAPDSWIFTAYRKDGEIPISQRSLDDPED